MSPLLDSIRYKLTAMEQEMQALPAELDSIMTRLGQSKLTALSLRLSQDFNKLLDKLFAAQRSGVLAVPLIIEPSYPFIRQITDEDLSRWRDSYKPKVRVVIGEGKVEVMAASELASECKMGVSQIAPVAQQRGYTVLGWDQYQRLLDEIRNLVGDEKTSETTQPPGATVITLPLSTKRSPKR